MEICTFNSSLSILKNIPQHFFSHAVTKKKCWLPSTFYIFDNKKHQVFLLVTQHFRLCTYFLLHSSCIQYNYLLRIFLNVVLMSLRWRQVSHLKIGDCGQSAPGKGAKNQSDILRSWYETGPAIKKTDKTVVVLCTWDPDWICDSRTSGINLPITHWLLIRKLCLGTQ